MLENVVFCFNLQKKLYSLRTGFVYRDLEQHYELQSGTKLFETS